MEALPDGPLPSDHWDGEFGLAQGRCRSYGPPLTRRFLKQIGLVWIGLWPVVRRCRSSFQRRLSLEKPIGKDFEHREGEKRSDADLLRGHAVRFVLPRRRAGFCRRSGPFGRSNERRRPERTRVVPVPQLKWPSSSLGRSPIRIGGGMGSSSISSSAFRGYSCSRGRRIGAASRP
jgi:hypothetical protein